MTHENANVLLKSEKTSQKKKIIIVWAISALLIIATIVSFIVDYSNYKEGQEFGLISATAASSLAGSSWVDKNDSYAEQCEDVYYKLNSHSYDITINGITYDRSEIRKTEYAIRDSFAEIMESAGYDRYNSWDIADWFKYTNITEYFLAIYWDNVLPICCYLIIVFSIIFTILVNHASKKELIVYEDSVLCVMNPRKSQQLFFEDINNVDFGKNSLKIVGTGVKFKISNLTNADSIKNIIIEKKKSLQNKSDRNSISNADELKKYKDLLDNGVITQEEFDAKKKQILGL